MSFLSNTLIAFSMSADAFAASVGKGMALQRPRFREAVRIGAIFGGVEAITPLLGWLIGWAASGVIASIDHWVAFGILTIIGLHMIYMGLSDAEDEKKESHRLPILILTAIGTSIDAMAVGATMALLNVNIWLLALMIGAATFIMSSIGIMCGHYLGKKSGKRVEILGGLCLIGIGTMILIEHLQLI